MRSSSSWARMRSSSVLARVAKAVKASGVQFDLHDLRRTVRTGLSRLGVSTETAELALGHARSELEAIYNRDDAAGALRLAFDRWADHVGSLKATTEHSYKPLANVAASP